MSLPASVLEDADTVASELTRIFDAIPSPATRLTDAMRYATMNGGKRMRAALVMAAARLATEQTATGQTATEQTATDQTATEQVAGSDQLMSGAVRVAAAVECLHAYSLIHDDLPAMDDADTRRGKPACHIEFDEATAILAGDALQTLAFELLAADETHPDPLIRARLVTALATASGIDGMAGGQMLDLQAETTPLDLDGVRQMQAMKTGALIQFAAVAGGMHGLADSALQAALARYSRDLGLAFQIADDCLDYDSDAESLGKPAGQDADRGKGSFVVLMGLDQAKHAAAALIDGAEAELAPWGQAAQPLCQIARFAIGRRS